MVSATLFTRAPGRDARPGATSQAQPEDSKNALPRLWDKHDHAVRCCLGGVAGELRSLVRPARALRCIDIGAGPELRYSNLLFWSLASMTNVPPVELDVVDPALGPASEERGRTLAQMYPGLTCRLHAATWTQFVASGQPRSSVDVIFTVQTLSVLADEELNHLFETAAQLLTPGGVLLTVHEILDRVTDPRYRGLEVYSRPLEDYLQVGTRHRLDFCCASLAPAHEREKTTGDAMPAVMAGVLFRRSPLVGCPTELAAPGDLP